MILVGLSIRIYLLELNYLFEGDSTIASRRGFLRLSRVLPTSRVFTSGYVNTETILHFFTVLLEKCGLKKGCTSADFHHYIFSRDRDQGFVSNGSKDVSHDN